MSKETEHALKNFDAEDAFSQDDLHHHFEEFAARDWCSIADEGLRIWNLMFEEGIESESPKDAVFNAIAAKASSGAFESVAAALGVDARALEAAVEPWYMKDQAAQSLAPVAPGRLLEMIEKSTEPPHS